MASKQARLKIVISGANTDRCYALHEASAVPGRRFGFVGLAWSLGKHRANGR